MVLAITNVRILDGLGGNRSRGTLVIRDARIIAGGQSLMAMLNMHLVSPKILVDISRIGELAYIRESDEALVLGTIVENPAQQLAGYEGAETTVVWNGMLLTLPPQ